MNHDARLVYLAHPRTASRTTRDVLLRLGFEQEYDRTDERGSHHATFPEGFDPKGYDVATTVRHHMDAFVSWWFYTSEKHRGGSTKPDRAFADALWDKRRRLFPDRTRLFSLHLPQATTALRFETLAEDLAGWLGRGGIGWNPGTSSGPLRWGHVGGRKRPAETRWRDVIRPDDVEQLAYRWREEMSELGYDVR